MLSGIYTHFAKNEKEEKNFEKTREKNKQKIERRTKYLERVWMNGVLLDCFALFELYIFVTALDFIYIYILSNATKPYLHEYLSLRCIWLICLFVCLCVCISFFLSSLALEFRFHTSARSLALSL